MIEIGAHIYNFLDNLKEKVLVVISADLAHTHKITHGPL